ncbi:MAG: hypothetical protein CM1200mP22_26390 [Dehalococcoidia bacterium]|nr:MAG: hypothetical protein CM1200mP22_26390 [Dehalococcoidia bacterium]
MAPKSNHRKNNGNVYVSDRGNHRKPGLRCPKGKFLLKWGGRGNPRRRVQPASGGPAIDSDGNVYVSEYGNHRIQVFYPPGRFLREWGIEGSGDGEF